MGEVGWLMPFGVRSTMPMWDRLGCDQRFFGLTYALATLQGPLARRG